MRLCVIPARGGSKRIPRKNIRPFLGRPIITWSIEAALACDAIDRVIVSTDDDEIARVARGCGAEVPFVRPAALSDDHATTLAVIAHALAWAESRGPIDSIVCLYATAPFVTPADLRGARAMLDDDTRYVFAATEFAFPVQRGFTLRDGRVEPMHPEHLDARSQDLPPAFHDAGQFYWCRPEAVRSGLPIFAHHSRPWLIDRLRAQDIDTPDDWRVAERLHALGR